MLDTFCSVIIVMMLMTALLLLLVIYTKVSLQLEENFSHQQSTKGTTTYQDSCLNMTVLCSDVDGTICPPRVCSVWMDAVSVECTLNTLYTAMAQIL